MNTDAVRMGLVPLLVALAVVLVALAAASRRAGVGARVTGAALAWLAVTGALAHAGVFQRVTVPPRVLLVAMTATVTLVMSARTAAGRRVVEAATLPGIAALQGFRVPVEVGLHGLYAAGVIPVQMTWSGRNFDVLVGVTAPLAALAFHRGWIGRRGFAMWHVASLGLLVNIVGTAALSFPGPMQRFAEGVSLPLLAQAPFVWLPAFLVPIAAASHIVSLRALARG